MIPVYVSDNKTESESQNQKQQAENARICNAKGYVLLVHLLKTPFKLFDTHLLHGLDNGFALLFLLILGFGGSC